MISEVFPLRLRGRGLSLAVLVNFGANALVTFAFSPLKVIKTFYLFAFLNMITIMEIIELADLFFKCIMNNFR